MDKSQIKAAIQSWQQHKKVLVVGDGPVINTEQLLACDIVRPSDPFFGHQDIETTNGELCKYYKDITRMSASGLKYVAYVKRMEDNGITIPILAKTEKEETSSLTLGTLIDDALTSEGHSISLLKVIPANLKQDLAQLNLTPTEKKVLDKIIEENSDVAACLYYCEQYNNENTRKAKALLEKTDITNVAAVMQDKAVKAILAQVTKIREAAKPYNAIIDWRIKNVGPDDILLDELPEISNAENAYNIVVNAFNKVKDSGALDKSDNVIVLSQLVILWDYDTLSKSSYLEEHSDITQVVPMKSMLDRVELWFDVEGNLAHLVIKDWKTSADISTPLPSGNYKKYQIYQQLAIYTLAIKSWLRGLGMSISDIEYHLPIICQIDFIPYSPDGGLVGYKSYRISEVDILAGLNGGYLKANNLSLFNEAYELQAFYSTLDLMKLQNGPQNPISPVNDNFVYGAKELITYYLNKQQ